jgi:hypothetical protein
MASGILNTKWLWTPVSLRTTTLHIEVHLPWDATVRCIAAVRHTAVLELASKGVGGVLAVVLVAAGALLTVRLQAGVGLRSNTNRIADLDGFLGFAADLDSFADDFMTDADGLSR